MCALGKRGLAASAGNKWSYRAQLPHFGLSDRPLLLARCLQPPRRDLEAVRECCWRGRFWVLFEAIWPLSIRYVHLRTQPRSLHICTWQNHSHTLESWGGANPNPIIVVRGADSPLKKCTIQITKYELHVELCTLTSPAKCRAHAL